MKITKDCYVNVKGWTEEEVQKAAEIFSKHLDCVIYDIDRTMDGYDYLHPFDGTVFVGNWNDVVANGCYTELSKEDVLGITNQCNNSLSDLLRVSKQHNLELSICAGEYTIIDIDDPNCKMIKAESEEEWLELIDCLVKIKGRIVG